MEPDERSERGAPAVEPAATAGLAPPPGGPEVGEPGLTGAAEVAEPEVAEQAEPEVAEQAEPEVAEQAQLAEPELGEAVRAAARRRRLAEVFGDVLPEATGDDRPESGSPAGADDRWYTENRPPHHGG
jgi:hypothetical protein